MFCGEEKKDRVTQVGACEPLSLGRGGALLSTGPACWLLSALSSAPDGLAGEPQLDSREKSANLALGVDNLRVLPACAQSSPEENHGLSFDLGP